MELKQCICLDLAGMLPDMAKSKMATKQSNGLKNLVEYLKHGTIPGE